MEEVPGCEAWSCCELTRGIGRLDVVECMKLEKEIVRTADGLDVSTSSLLLFVAICLLDTSWTRICSLSAEHDVYCILLSTNKILSRYYKSTLLFPNPDARRRRRSVCAFLSVTTTHATRSVFSVPASADFYTVQRIHGLILPKAIGRSALGFRTEMPVSLTRGSNEAFVLTPPPRHYRHPLASYIASIRV